MDEADEGDAPLVQEGVVGEPPAEAPIGVLVEEDEDAVEDVVVADLRVALQVALRGGVAADLSGFAVVGVGGGTAASHSVQILAGDLVSVDLAVVGTGGVPADCKDAHYYAHQRCTQG